MSTQAPVPWGSQLEPSTHPVLALQRRLTRSDVFSRLKDNRNHVSDTTQGPACGRTNRVRYLQACGVAVVHHTVLNCHWPVLVPLVLPAKDPSTVSNQDYREEGNTGAAVLTDHSHLIQKVLIQTLFPFMFWLFLEYLYHHTWTLSHFCQGCQVIQSFEHKFVTRGLFKKCWFFLWSGLKWFLCFPVQNTGLL